MNKQTYVYICQPTAEMRAGPDPHQEVVSQAFFSEAITILGSKGDWLKVCTCIDDYQGWIKKSAVYQRPSPFPSNPTPIAKVSRCAAHLYRSPDTSYGPILTLPFESRVEILPTSDTINTRWLKVALPDESHAFLQRGDITINPQPLNVSQMCELSLFFLGIPYTWGGRSSFGYDCSGYVQMLYRQRGLFIPRDSKDQCAWNKFRPQTLENLASGDLLFFGFSSDQIRHVGLALDKKRFIHAVACVENAPYVRISDLNDPEWNGSGHYPYRTARTYCT